MKRRSEQRALGVLQIILIAVAIGSLIFFLTKKKGDNDNADPKNELVSQIKEGGGDMSANNVQNEPNNEERSSSDASSSTHFDPNTADSATLVLVGFTPWQASNILKYRQKGGQYHRPEDVKKVYSLTVGQWERISPLIVIGKKFQYLSDNENVYASNYRQRPNSRASYSKANYPQQGNSAQQGNVNRQDPNAANTGNENRAEPESRTANRIQKVRNGERVDLNSDTATLQRIPGIGSYYAKRIAEYGKKLGGFTSVNQLNDKDLDFLPMDIEQYIALNTSHIKKLHINRLQVRELNNHPYISYPQARQICDRVRLYGPIKNWNELLFLSEFEERDKVRLEPYISFE